MLFTVTTPDRIQDSTVLPPREDDQDQVNPAVIFLLSVVLTGSLCLCGFVGNVLALIALCKETRKSSNVYLLCSLCIADWFMLLFLFNGVVVIKLCKYFSLTWYLEALTHSQHALPVIWCLGCIIQTTAIWLVVAVTWDRFIAVCWPFMRKRTNPISRAKKLIAGVITFAVLFNIPRFFHYHSIETEFLAMSSNSMESNFTSEEVIFRPLNKSSIHDHTISQDRFSSILSVHTPDTNPIDNNNKQSNIRGIGDNVAPYIIESSYIVYNLNKTLLDITTPDYHKQGDLTKSSPITKELRHNKWYHYIYYITLSWLVMYIVPLITLLVLNVILFRQIQRAQRNHAKLASNHREQENLSVTINIVAIVTVFIICQAPDFVHTLISYPTLGVSRPVQEYMGGVTYAFLALNSSLNFIIYCLFYKRFRRTVLHMFCRWHPKVQRQSTLEFTPMQQSSRETVRNSTKQGNTQETAVNSTKQRNSRETTGNSTAKKEVAVDRDGNVSIHRDNRSNDSSARAAKRKKGALCEKDALLSKH